MKDKSVVAFIAARGGSKRFKNKNIFLYNKKPLISYPIKAAERSKVFSDIIVATDSEKIAKISLNHGAKIFRRSKNSATDYAHETVSLREYLVSLRKSKKKVPALICMIYPTAILLKPKDITQSLKIIKKNKNVDVVMGISKYNYSPYKALSYNSKGHLKPVLPSKIMRRSQQYQQTFASNGTIYWHRTETFLKGKYQGHYGNKMIGYLMDYDVSLDIDNKSDLKKILTYYNL